MFEYYWYTFRYTFLKDHTRCFVVLHRGTNEDVIIESSLRVCTRVLIIKTEPYPQLFQPGPSKLIYHTTNQPSEQSSQDQPIQLAPAHIRRFMNKTSQHQSSPVQVN